MALGGYVFDTISVEVNEDVRPGEDPQAYVVRLAESKARAGAEKAPPGAVIVSADTTVVYQGEILGKPADAGEAESMLRRLRGDTHQVYTGLAVLRTRDGLLRSGVCATDVRMRRYGDDEIHAYIATGDPMDKAGAYAIQHQQFSPVGSIDGCYANVVGLPLCYLTRLLGAFGVSPMRDIAQICQESFEHACTIYQEVLGDR